MEYSEDEEVIQPDHLFFIPMVQLLKNVEMLPT
jgi:hypothetical protein